MRALISPFALSVTLAGALGSPAMADGIFDIAEEQAVTFLDVGAAVLSRPDYLGSDETQVTPLPYINAEYKGRWFINPITGAGAHIINKKPFRLSASVYFSPDRDGENTPLLTEDFDIDFGASARLAARVNFKYFVVDAIGSAPFAGGMDGTELQLIASTLLPVTDKLRIAPSAQINIGSEEWNTALYGLTQEQAVKTPFSGVSYSEGTHSYSASAAAFYDFSEKWQGVGVVSYSKLVGDLRDSPLVAREDGVTAVIGLARRF